MTRRATSEPTSGDVGFTLIEVIVSLAILGLILAMLPGAFQLGRRAWETTTRIDRTDHAAASRSFLEQRLTEAMPVSIADATGERQLGFTGDARRMMFVAPSASGPAGGGLYRFELTVEPGTSGDALVLRQSLAAAPPRPVGQEQGADERRVLFDGPRGLSFRYFGAIRDDAERTWNTEWRSRNALPELVELSADGVTTAPATQGTTAWQPLVVALRLRRAP